MKKFLFWLVLIILVALLAFDIYLLVYQHQRANPPSPPDLSGEWIADGMKAEIKGDDIRVYWIGDTGDYALYWAGTYERPQAKGKYSWTSTNYKDETEYALLASKTEEKVFEYDGKNLSCEVTAMGITSKTIFKKQK